MDESGIKIDSINEQHQEVPVQESCETPAEEIKDEQEKTPELVQDVQQEVSSGTGVPDVSSQAGETVVAASQILAPQAKLEDTLNTLKEYQNVPPSTQPEQVQPEEIDPRDPQRRRAQTCPHAPCGAWTRR